MKTTLMALCGSFLLATAATAGPPVPVQAPLQAPGKSAAQAPTQMPTQSPIQAPAKGQASAANTAPNMAYRGGYRTYSYQPSGAYRTYSYQPTAPARPYTPELVPQGFLNYPSYRRPVTGAGFNPAGYKSTGMWMMP